MNQIPARREFDKLTKEQRSEFLRNLRREFHDKQIREAWHMRSAAWYAMLKRCGLTGQNKENPSPRGPQLGETNAPSKLEQRRNKNRGKDQENGKVYDAEYTIIQDHEQQQPPAYPPALISTEEAVMLPFPTIKGTTVQLRKQFEAVALFLEGQEDESAKFEVRLSAVKV